MSATSTTKSESAGALRAFATFRVAGDQLLPEQVTKILNIRPTRAYKKGQRYSAGDRSPNLRGRTGVWYFSTDSLVPSTRLEDHLTFLVRLLFPGNLTPLVELHHLIQKRSLEAHVTLFWRGRHKAKKPVLPSVATQFFKLVPADVEFDAQTISNEPPRRRVA